jgi:hypothetical protein
LRVCEARIGPEPIKTRRLALVLGRLPTPFPYDIAVVDVRFVSGEFKSTIGAPVRPEKASSDGTRTAIAGSL